MISKEGKLSFVSQDAKENTDFLRKVAEEPAHQKKQRVLDLRFVPLLELPIEKMHALEAIYLHENQISRLPELHFFPRLQTLSLGRNQIRHIPRSITRIWMSFRRLILGANYIQSLPFTEEEMIIEHGSIGSNPISEPIGV